MKTHFTRKNFIAIGIVYFYCVMVLIAGLAIDAREPLFVSTNPIASLGNFLGLVEFNGSAQFYILLICFLIYVLIFTVAFIYEYRLAEYYDESKFSKKWIIVYSLTFLICLVLCFGIGLCAQYPYELDLISNNLLALGVSILLGLFLFLILGSFVFGITLIVVNFKNIDKPFRFFGSRVKELESQEKKEVEEEDKLLAEQGELAHSFGEMNVDASGNYVGGASAGASYSGAPAQTGESESKVLKDKEIVFPGLCSIDVANEANREEDFYDDDVKLDELCENFRKYLAKSEKLYFDIHTIRAFVSGLAASRLIILEGLSGTGKSSLARYFSDYISEDSFFEPVQATWRDRTSLLGFYNDFSKTYNETEFLKRLYDATYKTHHMNVMVLDEVNISRVEYYFADFLSILEYPVDKWALKIMQLSYDFDPPLHLENGILKIPANTRFIATANKDDSTFTITDKVYDRAITISFDDQNIPFEVNEEINKITLSYDKLTALFNEASNDKRYKLSEEDLTKFRSLINYTYQNFDITIGNRIMHQLEILVPVYVACGGKKEEALDFMFSRKVLSKLSGRFEDYLKDGLLNLKTLINKTYGENKFTHSFIEINRLLRKL